MQAVNLGASIDQLPCKQEVSLNTSDAGIMLRLILPHGLLHVWNLAAFQL